MSVDGAPRFETIHGDWQVLREMPQDAPERSVPIASPSGGVAPGPLLPPTAGHVRVLPLAEVVPEVAGEMDEVVMAPQATEGGGLRNALEAVAVGAGSPTPPETARSVALQLAAAVSGNGEGKFEIQLSPEELGRVTVTMQVTDDAVVLVVQAERQETLDLMRRHADILQREFREAGFTTLNFSFGQGGQDGRSPRPPAEPSGFDDLAAGPPALRSVHEGGRVAASSRLDLRL
jgi:hypothetical protein